MEAKDQRKPSSRAGSGSVSETSRPPAAHAPDPTLHPSLSQRGRRFHKLKLRKLHGARVRHGLPSRTRPRRRIMSAALGSRARLGRVSEPWLLLLAGEPLLPEPLLSSTIAWRGTSGGGGEERRRATPRRHAMVDDSSGS